MIHTIWFLGHFVACIGSLLYLRFEVGYNIALLGCIISYSTLLYRGFKEKKDLGTGMALVVVFKTINFMYWILALLFLVSESKCPPIIIPLFAYAFYHFLSHTSTNLAPKFAPSSTSFQKAFSLLEQTQSSVFEITCLFECFFTPFYLMYQVIRGYQTLLLGIVYLYFITVSYSVNKTTQKTFEDVKRTLDTVFVPLESHSNSTLNKIGGYWKKTIESIGKMQQKLHPHQE